MAYCINGTLKGIAGSCDSSMGGVKKVYITQYKDDLFTVAEGAVSNVEVGDATKWYEYAFKQDTVGMTSTLNIDAANGVNYVSTVLSLVFARQDTAKRIEMAALALNDLAVIVVDANGEWTALGVQNPVSATGGESTTGTAKGDGNNYSVELTDVNGSFPEHLTKDAIDAFKEAMGD